MRLTDKDGTYVEYIIDNIENPKNCIGKRILDNDLTHKLGLLEDLEEELKVGLDKIAKALLHGAYFVHMKANFHTEIVYSNRVKVDQGFIYYFLMKPKPSKDSDNYRWLYCWLNNYGKTWALTKEELL